MSFQKHKTRILARTVAVMPNLRTSLSGLREVEGSGLSGVEGEVAGLLSGMEMGVKAERRLRETTEEEVVVLEVFSVNVDDLLVVL